MENTENQKPKDAEVGGIGDSVLKYLAANHPDDEEALEEITRLLASGTDSEEVIAALYKGIRYDSDLKAADDSGYLRGRNEAVTQERQKSFGNRPKDDGGAPEAYDLPLLRSIRRSVWD